MKLEVVCNACKSKFKIGAEEVNEIKAVFGNHEDELMLTYFSCPECGKQYSVLIDDEKSSQIKSELITVMGKASRYMRKGQMVPKKTVSRANELRNKLSNRRKVLNERYNHSFYQCGESKQQLELCVPDTKILEKGETYETN